MDRYSPSTWGECDGLNTLICNLFIIPPNVGLGRSPYWSNKKRLGRHSNSVLPTWGICNFRLNGKGPEDQGRTEYKHTGGGEKLTCTFEQSQRDTYAGHPLWSLNCCKPLQVQMSNCSLFELACVPNSTCRHLICSSSMAVGKYVLAYFTLFAQQQSHFTKFYICPFLFVFIPLYYFHFFPSRARWLSPCACIYIGGTALEKWLKSCPVDQGGLWGLSML